MITNHLAPEWTRICSVQDILVLGSNLVARAQGRDVTVFRNGVVGLLALLDSDLHKGGAVYLDKGYLATLAIKFTRLAAGLTQRVVGV